MKLSDEEIAAKAKETFGAFTRSERTHVFDNIEVIFDDDRYWIQANRLPFSIRPKGRSDLREKRRKYDEKVGLWSSPFFITGFDFLTTLSPFISTAAEMLRVVDIHLIPVMFVLTHVLFISLYFIYFVFCLSISTLSL